MGRSKQPARRSLADLMRPKPGTYQVRWHWRDSGEVGYDNEVKATNAQRAINKVFAELSDEYEITKRDIVFDEVFLNK